MKSNKLIKLIEILVKKQLKEADPHWRPTKSQGPQPPADFGIGPNQPEYENMEYPAEPITEEEDIKMEKTLKITKNDLIKIIKEEYKKVLKEKHDGCIYASENPEKIKPKEGVWEGGDNIEKEMDWNKKLELENKIVSLKEEIDKEIRKVLGYKIKPVWEKDEEGSTRWYDNKGKKNK